jgi:hypothetical protein
MTGNRSNTVRIVEIAELLHVLMLPDLERAERIGEFWSYPQSRTFAQRLIDREKDRTASGGARRDAAGGGPSSTLKTANVGADEQGQ